MERAPTPPFFAVFHLDSHLSPSRSWECVTWYQRNEIEADAQLKVLVESHMQQRASKRTIEFEATERREKCLPPHKVQVTRHGKIDGAYQGKDTWDGAIRSLAPRILNMAVVQVIE
jgi:hypothetical protein